MPPCRRHLCWALLLLAVLAVVGCLTDASDKDFAFNNKIDPNPDDDETTGGSIRIGLVVPVGTAEVVLLVNPSTVDVDLSDWTIQSEATGDYYVFGTYTLGAGDIVRVHSATGTDDPDDLYGETPYVAGQKWEPDEGGDHFNSTDDSVFLRQGDVSSGTLIDTCNSTDPCWGN